MKQQVKSLANETSGKLPLEEFARKMNPKGIDIASLSPQLEEAVQNNPNDGYLVLAFPDIDSSNIIIGGDDTRIIGDVRFGRANAVMEGCHIRADGKPIIIGNGNNFQNGVTMHISRSRNASVIIGNHNSLTHQVIWHGASCGNNCFVALGSTVNDGAYMEDGSFVDSNSNVQAEVRLKAGMAYEGRIESDTPPKGKFNEVIILYDVDNGHKLKGPVGEITDRYAKGQIRSAQSRRLLTANKHGSIDPSTGKTQPAYAYIEHVTLQTAAHYLKRSAQILFHFQDNELAREALSLVQAIDVIFRGQKITPEAMAAWSKKGEIIENINSKLNELTPETQNAIPIKSKKSESDEVRGLLVKAGMNDPILITEEFMKTATRKLERFLVDMKSVESLITNRESGRSQFR